MFLLNLWAAVENNRNHYFTSQYVSIKSRFSNIIFKNVKIFTSQYVSIKSPNALLKIQLMNTLHPNMFLLNQYCVGECRRNAKSFTSQYVSIKSYAHCHSYYLYIPPLHPNMFLLNHNIRKANSKKGYFTSQYVSIKSLLYTDLLCLFLFFTSQYVSIKSHTNIIPYFPSLSTPFLSTAPK